MRNARTRGITNPNKVFEQTGGLHSGRSRFDLSHQVITTADMGQLIPVMAKQVIPGDTWKTSVIAVLRFNPLLAPLLHEANVYFYDVFVPHRIVDDQFEEYITGGATGDTTVVPPRWTPTSPTKTIKGSLWDYLGFPIDVEPTGTYTPLDYPKRAYNLFYNEFVRDQNLDTEIDIETNEDVLFMRWEKDYFASALPFQQRGTAPAIPITGTTSAIWDSSVVSTPLSPSSAVYTASTVTAGQNTFRSITTPTSSAANATSDGNWLGALNDNTVNLATAGATITINDIRTTAVLQQWMELNARAGARYTEYLSSMFGQYPEDSRLQRPELLGRAKIPVIVSEVVQTSATTTEPTPQGNLAGKGVAVDNQYMSNYHAKEHGTILRLMCIRPRAVYTQGFPREWMPQSVFDNFTPQFAHLSEQAIMNGEVFAVGTDAGDMGIWGYQQRYSEYRYAKSRVCGLMHDDLDFWHIARQFPSLPALNSDFLSQADIRKDYLAVDTEPAFVVSVGNNCIVDRPIPAIPTPGISRI